MEIFWGGQALFRLKGKSATAIIDPFDPTMLGIKLPKDMQADIVLKTHDHGDHNNIAAVTGEPVVIAGPGEYEIKGVAIIGVTVFHDDKQGAERGKNTVYNLYMDGLNIVHLGDIGDVLTQSQIEEIGTCDILMIPVGSVFTIDAKKATEIIAQLEPRIVIPMHYGGLEGLKPPLEPVTNFLKEVGHENLEPQPKLSITRDKLPEEMQVVLLAKS
jgi:L-ascorbate metabolism protein UlaG (beta-lactamase superfamily)